MFVSPLANLRLPDVPALLAWADDDGRRILSDAARLAVARTELTARVHAAPQVGASPERLAARLTRTDLLRALVARKPDALGLGSLRDFSFGEAPVRWTRMLEEDLAAAEVVERSLARSWALERLRVPGASLGVDGIVAALGFEGAVALTAFDANFVEGLITREESACRILDGQGAAGVGVTASAPVWPVYFDRHGGLGALNDALSGGPGAVVVAEEPGVGRHALLEAFVQCLMYGTAPRALDGFDASAQALDVRRLNQDFFRTSDDAFLFGFYRGRPGACLDLRSAEGRRPGWMDDLGPVTEDAIAGRAKVLVTVPAERESALRSAHPAFASWPRIVVPPARDAGRIALWWCQLPYVERRIGLAVRLPELMEAFARSTPEERARADWRTVAYAVERARVAAGLERGLAPRPAPWARWASALRKVRAGRELAEPEQSLLDRFVGSRADLVALADAALSVEGAVLAETGRASAT